MVYKGFGQHVKYVPIFRFLRMINYFKLLNIKDIFYNNCKVELFAILAKQYTL